MTDSSSNLTALDAYLSSEIRGRNPAPAIQAGLDRAQLDWLENECGRLSALIEGESSEDDKWWLCAMRSEARRRASIIYSASLCPSETVSFSRPMTVSDLMKALSNLDPSKPLAFEYDQVLFGMVDIRINAGMAVLKQCDQSTPLGTWDDDRDELIPWSG